MAWSAIAHPSAAPKLDCQKGASSRAFGLRALTGSVSTLQGAMNDIHPAAISSTD
jgi:hypothetical protein